MLSPQDAWALTTGAWPVIWLTDTSRYLVTAGAVALALACLPAAWLARRRVRIRQVARHQVRREVAHSLLTALIFSLVGGGVFMGHQSGLLKVYEAPGAYGWPWFAASLALIVLAHDAWFYWTHRWMHRRHVFRWTHHTHHQSMAPTPWAAYAFSPPEALLQALFLPVFLLFLPAHPLVLFAWMAHMVVRNVLGHAGTELIPRSWLAGWWGRWLTTALHHELHHARGHGNYGLYFVWWDRWCGTQHRDYQDKLWALVGGLHHPIGSADPARQGRHTASAGAIVALVAGLLSTAAPRALASDVVGEWSTQGYSARVDVKACEKAPDRLCGTITWLWEPTDKQGNAVLDVNNADAALRTRPLVGLAMLSGFKSATEPGTWVEGHIYNPEDGRTYGAKLKLRARDVLEVEGCVLFICARQVWRRVPPGCNVQRVASAFDRVSLNGIRNAPSNVAVFSGSRKLPSPMSMPV